MSGREGAGAQVGGARTPELGRVYPIISEAKPPSPRRGEYELPFSLLKVMNFAFLFDNYAKKQFLRY